MNTKGVDVQQVSIFYLLKGASLYNNRKHLNCQAYCSQWSLDEDLNRCHRETWTGGARKYGGILNMLKGATFAGVQ